MSQRGLKPFFFLFNCVKSLSYHHPNLSTINACMASSLAPTLLHWSFSYWMPLSFVTSRCSTPYWPLQWIIHSHCCLLFYSLQLHLTSITPHILSIIYGNLHVGKYCNWGELKNLHVVVKIVVAEGSRIPSIWTLFTGNAKTPSNPHSFLLCLLKNHWVYSSIFL